MTKAERLERDRLRLAEMKAHEDELRSQGYNYIAGIDEVGRGPLAGPVYAACVVLPEDFDVTGINDSKKLSAKRRDELSEVIRERALAYGIGIADNNEIDEINILEATKCAMKRAIEACNEKLREAAISVGSEITDEPAHIDMLLIDAVKLDVDISSESIIKGDEKSLSIAAASIVAKVARDNYMAEMDSVYPGYDFAGNKGYGTAKHYEGLRSLGYTPIHRKSFLRKFEEEQRMVRSEDSALSGKKSKVYAVKVGRNPGIYNTWDECKAQIDGYSGAVYKRFTDPGEAVRYLGTEDISAEERFPEGVRAYVDGSYDVSTGRYSCGVVMIRTDAEGNVRIRELNASYSNAEAAKQRNVAGEIMGSKMAIEFCLKNGINEVEIYHDYEGVGRWPDGDWKARNPLTQAYADFVRRARQQMKITFVKVAAHTGNKYNELADKLAKEALGIEK